MLYTHNLLFINVHNMFTVILSLLKKIVQIPCKIILQIRFHLWQQICLNNFCFTRFVGYALIKRNISRTKDSGQSCGSFLLEMCQLFVQFFLRSITCFPKYLHRKILDRLNLLKNLLRLLNSREKIANIYSLNLTVQNKKKSRREIFII